MNPAVLEAVDASALTRTAVANEAVLLLNAGVARAEKVLPVIHEVFEDINTTVGAALVAEGDVLLLEDAADTDTEVPAPLAVLVNAVSATSEGPGVLAVTAPAGPDVERDKLLSSARAAVRVGTVVDVTRNPEVFHVVNAANTLLDIVSAFQEWSGLKMMMIAFITFKSSLVPLFEGL